MPQGWLELTAGVCEPPHPCSFIGALQHWGGQGGKAICGTGASPWQSPGLGGAQGEQEEVKGRNAARTTQGGSALLQHMRHRSDQDLGTRSICPPGPWVLLVLKPPCVITHVTKATTSIASHSRQPGADLLCQHRILDRATWLLGLQNAVWFFWEEDVPWGLGCHQLGRGEGFIVQLSGPKWRLLLLLCSTSLVGILRWCCLPGGTSSRCRT